ncbi:MAG: ASKHA domain-containing protein [Candidatus Syntropharchaeia archaeon]
MDYCRIIFLPDGKKIDVPPGTTILDALRDAGIGIRSACGGEGRCGECKIIVTKNPENLNEPEEKELKMLSNEERKEGYRLACLARILDDVVVTVPIESKIGKQKLQIEGVEKPVTLDPYVSKYVIGLPIATFEDGRTDKKRLLDAIKDVFGLKGLSIEYSVYRDLPLRIRKGNWIVTVVVWGDERILSVESGASPEMYGFAVDVGTTKIAGYLIDLHSGEVVDVKAEMNPQIRYGEDVITRIRYTMEGEKRLDQLQKAVIDAINRMLYEICMRNRINRENVYEVTVAGNTAMHHLFLGICPKYVAWSPYCPALGSENIKASDIGVNANNANVYLFPVIGGFVGGDCVSAILSTGIAESEKICMLLDIGTNTEIVLGNEESLVCCSCASGPAFEGFRIKHGMRASSGAIERVKIDPETFEVEYKTIDNEKPIGLCGSALVDLLAEMLKAGIMDVSGNLNPELDTPKICKKSGGLAFVVSPKEKNRIFADIVITQQDIRELQLAKAAIHTGAEILMQRMKIREKDIEMLYIAGAFGSFIDPENARTIGMYPEVDLEKVKLVGNAAGSGAKMALISKEEREKAEYIAKNARYIELATQPEFTNEYMKSNYFPYADPRRYPEVTKMLKDRGIPVVLDGVQRRLMER